MKATILAAAASMVLAAGLIAGRAHAHHSFAMFDSGQHKLIEGEVTEWNYNNPHSWLIVQAPGPDGAMTTWSFEGAAIVHAARQGVNGKSYVKGEKIRVVMHPLRDGRNAGALCFVIRKTVRSHGRTTASATPTQCTRAGRRRAGSRRASTSIRIQPRIKLEVRFRFSFLLCLNVEFRAVGISSVRTCPRVRRVRSLSSFVSLL
jgi:hypothetical protein